MPFGRIWNIRDLEGRAIAELQLFPMKNKRTHYAGVQYRVLNGKDNEFIIEVDESSEIKEVLANLQEVIGKIIVELLVKLARD